MSARTSFAAEGPAIQVVVSLIFAGCLGLLGSFVTIGLQSAHHWSVFFKYVTLAGFIMSFIAALIDFVFVFGVGLDTSTFACEAAGKFITVCYALTKVTHHCFLAERLHIVYTSHLPRHRSPAYWMFVGVCGTVAGLACYIIKIIRDYIEPLPVPHCKMGFHWTGTLAVLLPTVLLDVFLTVLFLVPIYKASFGKSKKLANRTALANIASMTVISANLIYLPVIGGSAKGWIFTLGMTLDVTLNACILFLLTERKSQRRDSNAVLTASARATGSTSHPEIGARVRPEATSSTLINLSGRHSLGSPLEARIHFPGLKPEDLDDFALPLGGSGDDSEKDEERTIGLGLSAGMRELDEHALRDIHR